MIVDERRVRRAEMRMRLAGVFIALGLFIEWLSLRGTTPSSFMVFAAGIGVCFPVGIVLFLSSLIRTGPLPRQE